MAQSLAWGADLLPSPRVALGVSLAIALQVASASSFCKHGGSVATSASPMGEGTRGCLIALGQMSGRRVSLGLVICVLEMEREALRGSKS